MLQLLTSQKINEIPFIFRGTGIRVYSIEEALYHVYHYWRESVDDFASAQMIAWVAEIGLIDISKKIKSIAEIESFTKRMLAFLRIIEYFDETELSNIKSELVTWESRVEWERLKDQADRLVSGAEPAKAIPLYTKALKLAQNSAMLNNMAIAYMRLGNYEKAASLLAKAHANEPENNSIILHYAESLILMGDYETAARTLASINSPKSAYLRGLMAYSQGDYPGALKWLESNPDFRASHKIADIYLEANQLDKALAALHPEDPAYHEKASEIYAAYGHARIPEAISHIKKAIELDKSTGAMKLRHLWAKLAKYYRNDYDWNRAAKAIENAMPPGTIAPPATLLEYARIKKGQGRTREYQAALGHVLDQLKEQYRF